MSDPCAFEFQLPEGFQVRRGNPGWMVFYGTMLIHSGFKTYKQAKMYASAFHHGFQIGSTGGL